MSQTHSRHLKNMYVYKDKGKKKGSPKVKYKGSGLGFILIRDVQSIFTLLIPSKKRRILPFLCFKFGPLNSRIQIEEKVHIFILEPGHVNDLVKSGLQQFISLLLLLTSLLDPLLFQLGHGLQSLVLRPE